MRKNIAWESNKPRGKNKLLHDFQNHLIEPQKHFLSLSIQYHDTLFDVEASVNIVSVLKRIA